jgi:hypothetical protein
MRSPEDLAMDATGGLRGGLRMPAEPMARLLLDAMEQFAGRYVEGARESHDGVEAWVSSRTLKQRDLGAVETTGVAKCFLGEAVLQALGSKIAGEPLACVHDPDALRSQTKPLQTKPLLSVRVAAKMPAWASPKD